MPAQRGSITDSITLTEYPFFYDPKVKEKATTVFGKQHIIGHRLPGLNWVGSGDNTVELDVFFTEQTGVDLKAILENFRGLLNSQPDIGSPHPVFINVGSMYVGRRFVMTACDTDVEVYKSEQSMLPRELNMKLKFEEVPVDLPLIGAGARS